MFLPSLAFVYDSRRRAGELSTRLLWVSGSREEIFGENCVVSFSVKVFNINECGLFKALIWTNPRELESSEQVPKNAVFSDFFSKCKVLSPYIV